VLIEMMMLRLEKANYDVIIAENGKDAILKAISEKPDLMLLDMLQTLLIIILYFDFRADALAMTAIFAITNILFSKYSIDAGLSWYGYGYFFSCLVALTFGFLLFNYRMKHLLNYTFVSQKIIVHSDTVAAL